MRGEEGDPGEAAGDREQRFRLWNEAQRDPPERREQTSGLGGDGERRDE
jgi:hypothetical protein